MLISKAVLRWESAYAVSYKIQVSSGASQWIDIYSTDSGDGDIDEIEFSPVSASYVRVYGISRATQWGYSLWEMEVY